ncbi:hypothetical protein KCU78_g82, partial [Aureobasidium melanogenum]
LQSSYDGPSQKNTQNPLQDASDINNSRSQISDEAKTKAFVWATLCCLDRISSLLLDLEPCTRALGFQPEAIVPLETTVTRRLFWSITELTIDILDRDKRYRLYPDISKITTDTALIHQRLCFLSTGVAESWHSSSSCDESSLSSFCHILMRYLIDYLSLRLHIPLMMHSKDLVEATNSRLISLDACRSMAKRYRVLRSPQFALLISARIIDFIAFTPVIILLFSLHHGLGESENLPTSVDIEADRVLLKDFVDALREVSSLHGSSTAAQVVTAVDTLENVLGNDDATAEDATLRIPLLGLIKIRRKVQANPQSATTDDMDLVDSSWTQLLNNSMHETWLQGWETSQNHITIFEMVRICSNDVFNTDECLMASLSCQSVFDQPVSVHAIAKHRLYFARWPSEMRPTNDAGSVGLGRTFRPKTPFRTKNKRSNHQKTAELAVT